MYKSSKDFLFWILILAIGTNLLIYLFGLLFRMSEWIFAEPDSIQTSTQYIFFGGIKQKEFIETRLEGFVLWLVVGAVWWAIEKYYFKRWN